MRNKIVKKCSVAGCDRPLSAKGLCSAHWLRLYRYGNLQEGRAIGDKSGAYNPHWKGGIVKIVDGRIGIYQGLKLPYKLRYRVEVERIIGRQLNSTEIVHHKDGCSTHDVSSNYAVMSRSEHMKHHSKARQRDSKGRWI